MREAPKRVASVTLLSSIRGLLEEAARENYSSMIPLFSPIIAAWVRSFALNFERMLLTRLFTVSSVIESYTGCLADADNLALSLPLVSGSGLLSSAAEC